MMIKKNESIGGFFEIELSYKKELYDKFIKTNSARNALVYSIKANAIKKIFMPYYNCNVVTDAVIQFCPETDINYYHIDSFFNPILDEIPISEWFYYVNYYGLQDHFVQKIDRSNVIVDNAQAFYSPAINNGSTIYCPRKFFGVCDGGYLKTNIALEQPLPVDKSWENATHLLKRIDCGAPDTYAEFKASDKALTGKSLMKMSRLTKRILSGIDYEEVKRKRIDNFNTLSQTLNPENKLLFLIELASTTRSFVPLCYPFLIDEAERLRNRLVQNNIFTPTYWPELKMSTELNEHELNFVHKIVCLPVDQRYGKKEMNQIIKVIKSFLEVTMHETKQSSLAHERVKH